MCIYKKIKPSSNTIVYTDSVQTAEPLKETV
jgi:hypothetical protein